MKITATLATTALIATTSSVSADVITESWQFVKDDNGQLRIVLHHSSLEFTGDWHC